MSEPMRARLAAQLRSPMDPDDERAELDHLDRAVFVCLGVAAAGGAITGQPSLAHNTPTGIAGEELLTYLRELFQGEWESGYNAGHEDGYNTGHQDGEDSMADRIRNGRVGGP